MYHRVKKIKFRAGKDANKMLVKKLLFNFLTAGKITTTLKKTKVLKSMVEKLVEKAKEKTEANKNYVLRLITDKKTIRFLFDTIGPTLKDKKGGYVKVVRLGSRSSDGSETARLEWAYPVMKETIAEKQLQVHQVSKVHKEKKTL